MISSVDVEAYCGVRIDDIVRAVIDIEDRLCNARLVCKASDEGVLQRLEGILVDGLLAFRIKTVHPLDDLSGIAACDLKEKPLEVG